MNLRKTLAAALALAMLAGCSGGTSAASTPASSAGSEASEPKINEELSKQYQNLNLRKALSLSINRQMVPLLQKASFRKTSHTARTEKTTVKQPAT